MSSDNDGAIDALRDATRKLADDRYGDLTDPRQVDERAAQAGDVEYLLARVRYLEADRDRAQTDVRWLSRDIPVAPKDAVARIRAICKMFPDLFSAVFVVLATHQRVPRKALAAAVKAFRSDTSALSDADVAGLLAGLWNSGREGFESILRTRKGHRSKAGAPAWVKTDE
jgi:hypothetical protein